MELAGFSDKQLAIYNKAIEVLDSLKVEYDKYHLICMGEDNLKKIAQGEASCGGYTVYGHLKDYAYNINPRLRMGNTDSWQRVLLDAGFESLTSIDRPETVYRLVTGSEEDKISFEYMKKLLGLKKGESFIDKGYSHTSYMEDHIAACGASQNEGMPQVKQTILVPAGAKVSDGRYLPQVEMLFPRNSEFRVIEPVHEVSKGFAEILLEYILPKVN